MLSFAHLINTVSFTLFKAQLAWPWLRGLYDFKVGHWGEHLSWRSGLMMNHPFWFNGDNTLHDATPNAAAAALRSVRPHLGGLHLVSVTCDTHVQPLPMPSASQLSNAKRLALASTAVRSAF